MVIKPNAYMSLHCYKVKAQKQVSSFALFHVQYLCDVRAVTSCQGACSGCQHSSQPACCSKRLFSKCSQSEERWFKGRLAFKKEVQKCLVLHGGWTERTQPLHSTPRIKTRGWKWALLKILITSAVVMSAVMQPNAPAVFSMSNEGFVSPPSLHPSLSLLSMCHICGLCGDVSLLRMDSPAQKRPYYIYILLHH